MAGCSANLGRVCNRSYRCHSPIVRFAVAVIQSSFRYMVLPPWPNPIKADLAEPPGNFLCGLSPGGGTGYPELRSKLAVKVTLQDLNRTSAKSARIQLGDERKSLSIRRPDQDMVISLIVGRGQPHCRTNRPSQLRYARGENHITIALDSSFR